ncbi:MFS transporter [Streptantibioticus silvisoli]|uniref:MFS transporter n=1 Tax=Streptantibioticus silvisoli TaxID=2705255 RepID=A0ABT6W590_9ACTN|nr:MFS transporter [Streptantibioticus silvisoli]MDI5965449.1 MFS transporter [Streptantibioticus silvisoli]
MWRDRDFRRLWAGQTASQLGEQTTLIVLPLYAVLALNAGAGELGVLRAVGQVPVLLLSLLAGAWVDRWRTRTVMVMTDAGRSLVLGAAAVAGLLGRLGLPALLVVALAAGALSVFFDVAYQASLVRLVERGQLLRGNSALEGSRSAAQIGGPALGGALVSLLSAPIAAVCGAVFFALSFLSLRRMRRTESVPERPDRSRRVGRRIHEGLRFVVGDTSLRTVCLASAAFQFSFAAMMTVYLLFLPRQLHLPGAAVGLALAVTGPGALLGSMLAARLPGRFGHGAVLVFAAALGDGVFLAVPALHGSSAVTVCALLAIAFVFGTAGQLVNVTVMAIRQTVTPDGMQARVAATISFVGMGMAPPGSLLGGFLPMEWGLRTSLLVTAVGMLSSPVLMALSPLARLGRTLPAARNAPPPAGRTELPESGGHPSPYARLRLIRLRGGFRAGGRGRCGAGRSPRRRGSPRG